MEMNGFESNGHSEARHHAVGIADLRLAVRIGETPGERSQEQEISISVEFRFLQPPTATRSDRISETICYGRLSTDLRDLVKNREFHLIERLANDVYLACAKAANRMAKVAVEIRKIKPPIEGLLGGAYYRCGDFVR